ncbi:MAG: HNH endonuclease signature motif containing protein [Microthrixaceae bacterium]
MFDDERGTGAGFGEADGMDYLEQLRAELAAEELAREFAPSFELTPATSALTAAAQIDTALVTDRQLLDAARQLETLRRSLDAASLRVLGELDARGVCDDQTGLHTGAWLAAEANLAPAGCRSRVRLAGDLRNRLDAVDAALVEGRVGVDHAKVLADAAANSRITDTFIELIPELLDAATKMRFEPWRRHIASLVSLLDTDGPEPHDDPLDTNTLSLTRGLSGIWNLKGQLTSELGAAVRAALDAEADRLFHARRRDENITPELRRPPRRTLLALSLHEITRAHIARTHPGTGPAGEISLHVNAADPHTAYHDDGTHIGDTDRLTLMCDPLLRTIVMGTHRTILDIGDTQRLATRAQRRAMANRDGGCVFPACDQPPTWTDAHHVLHWLHDGPTDLDNLASLCRHHHSVTHRTDWTMHVTDDEWFWWTTPNGHTFWSQRHGHQRAGPTPDTG